MAYEHIRKEYNGGAVATTLASAITAGAMSLTLTAGVTYPSGSIGPFVISVGRNTGGAEEHILCSARVGNVVTVQVRGYDGTTAVSHDTGDTVLHVLDAHSINQANAMANAGTAVGDLVRYAGSGLWTRVAPGDYRDVLQMEGGVPVWGPFTSAHLSAEAYTEFTPTLTQGVTVAKALSRSEYQRLGRGIRGDVVMVTSGVGTLGSRIDVGLPVAAAGLVGFTVVGTGFVFMNDSAIVSGQLVLLTGGLTAAFLIPELISVPRYAGVPDAANYQLVADCYISYHFDYEAAA